MRWLLKALLWGAVVVVGVVSGLAAQRMLSGNVVWMPALSVDRPQAGAELLGRSAPKLQLRDTQGVMRQLTDWRGVAVLVNFWATWCPPCREEIPDLAVLHKTLKDAGFAVIGVALDEAQPVHAFLQAFETPYTNLIASGVAGAPIQRQWGNPMGMLPYSVAIDRQGRVVDTHLGVLSPSHMRAMADLAMQ